MIHSSASRAIEPSRTRLPVSAGGFAFFSPQRSNLAEFPYGLISEISSLIQKRFFPVRFSDFPARCAREFFDNMLFYNVIFNHAAAA
ncbi:hypothetical protein E5163_04165 [Marinicauda algicola]|uniref:Uncharacterized protein n=1 Tax=Marinicauda algicola TaxID=2029849 RepID=A0A4V6RF62_9PROT|nr:hypothetical protein [Marinicauda algicola]TGY90329.1 hypothetical protein E5163_04165 [Marinicauda algicola]